MERETHTVVTPVNKHNLVLKSYITGREKRALISVLTKDVTIEMKGDVATPKGFKGEIIEQAENAALTAVIVSVDAVTENVIEAVLNMHVNDYDFVVAEVNKITSAAAFEQKKTI